jgi:hypothetical protein
MKFPINKRYKVAGRACSLCPVLDFPATNGFFLKIEKFRKKVYNDGIDLKGGSIDDIFYDMGFRGFF